MATAINSGSTRSSDLSNRLAAFSNRLGLAWWVEIKTESPDCTYYFGPFLNQTEAQSAVSGFIEDLEQEQAQGITSTVKRCKPQELTIES